MSTTDTRTNDATRRHPSRARDAEGPWYFERRRGSCSLLHRDIPSERLSLLLIASTETEFVVLDRILALLNAADGCPTRDLPAHAERLGLTVILNEPILLNGSGENE